MKTLALPEVVASLCSLAGCDREMAESFVAELEKVVAEGLIASGSVEVQGIGAFRKIDMPGEMVVEFAPSESLAEIVNAPFSMFEPIELDDDVTADMLDRAANEVPGQKDNELEIENEAHPEEAGKEVVTTNVAPVPATEYVAPKSPSVAESETDVEDYLESNQKEESTSEAEDESASEEEPDVADNTVCVKDFAEQSSAEVPVTREHIIERETIVETNHSHHHHPLYIVLAGLCGIIVGLFTGYLLFARMHFTGVRNVSISTEDVSIVHMAPVEDATDELAFTVEDSSAIAESARNDRPKANSESNGGNAPEKNVRPVVTDIVKSNRFLTTMALEHYGKKKFWVYIYKENEAKLGNPDQIAPNTEVVIPAPEKYGIKAGDKESEANAEKLAVEILEKYR